MQALGRLLRCGTGNMRANKAYAVVFHLHQLVRLKFLYIYAAEPGLPDAFLRGSCQVTSVIYQRPHHVKKRLHETDNVKLGWGFHVLHEIQLASWLQNADDLLDTFVRVGDGAENNA